VDYIAVHGSFFDPATYGGIIAALDHRTDMSLVVAAPWQGGESRLYRLQR
jgi:hypothetical protein